MLRNFRVKADVCLIKLQQSSMSTFLLCYYGAHYHWTIRNMGLKSTTATTPPPTTALSIVVPLLCDPSVE